MRYISLFTHKARNTGPSQQEIAAMGKLIEEGKKEGWLVTTEGVAWGDTGTRVQSADGKISVTDGPFAEAKEVVGGFAVMQVKSKEEALALTRRFLAVAGDGTCELHQLFEM
ncbi:MAG TPA: YciI family protein [Polyangia bacterium]|nr:YciI family protein [Polyangia bacterium]